MYEPINPEYATNGRATAALILGILSFVFAGVLPIGIILAIISLVIAGKYKRNHGQLTRCGVGRVFAVIGLIISIILLILIIWFVGFVSGTLVQASDLINPVIPSYDSPFGFIFEIPS